MGRENWKQVRHILEGALERPPVERAGFLEQACGADVKLRSEVDALLARDENAEGWLEAAGIIVNKNGIPNDPRPPRVTSGLRLGTPALTTRGLKEAEMSQVAALIDRVLSTNGDAAVTKQVREDVRTLCARFPLW